MDKRIQLGYCTFEGFKILAKNYLDIEDHPLFHTVKQLLQKREITPADVAEYLMPKSTDSNCETSLQSLIGALENAPRKAKQEVGIEESTLSEGKEQRILSSKSWDLAQVF
ncbi:hypothetical protein BVC80_8763g3 [Macleaya cordata]|uniref:AAA+ ATPase At3g28540-like C-terminal domain-containing protein n=1 Tax=Macleaya cordata TaxID=56857 RepID=A0A200QNC5_MACCD|nr:hypothetical protein BVC80_8763g3 [Macleaya cordata]